MICKRCEQEKRLAARGLCSRCYHQVWQTGEVQKYQGTKRGRPETGHLVVARQHDWKGEVGQMRDELAQKEKALQVAQALVGDFQRLADRQRAQLEQARVDLDRLNALYSATLERAERAEGAMARAVDRFFPVALAAAALAVHLKNTNRITDARYYDNLVDALEGLNGSLPDNVAEV